MKFELLVAIRLICLDSLEATSYVKIQLIGRVLVLEHQAEEVNAFDAPHYASLRDATDRVWCLLRLVILELKWNLGYLLLFFLLC